MPGDQRRELSEGCVVTSLISHNDYKSLIFKDNLRSPRSRRRCRRVAAEISAQQFRQSRVFSGLDREQASQLLGVSLRTIGHWETGHSRPSFAAFKLLRLFRHGDLLHPAWSSYRISREGELVTPEGHHIGAHEMTWLSLLVRRAKAFSDLLAERDGRRGLALGRPITVASNDAGQGDGAAVSPSQTVMTTSCRHSVDGYTSLQHHFSPVVASNRPVAADGPTSNTGQKTDAQRHHGEDSYAIHQAGAQRSASGSAQDGSGEICRANRNQLERAGCRIRSRLSGHSSWRRSRTGQGRGCKPAACRRGAWRRAGSANRHIASCDASGGNAIELGVVSGSQTTGWSQRPVSLRKRKEGEALPSGALLSAGGVA